MTFHPDSLIKSLYDITLDPTALNGFIDLWNDAGLDKEAARQRVEIIGRFDETFQTT